MDAISGEDRLIGPPGTGKTTELSRILAYHAKRVGSDAVVAISHTKAAAAELAGRRTPIPHDNIATLHALAFRALGRPKLAEDTDGLKAFSADHPQWRMEASLDADEASFQYGGAPGDILLSDYSRLRNLMQPRELWPMETQAFAKAWEQFKVAEDMIDFTDMIDLAARDTTCPDHRFIFRQDGLRRHYYCRRCGAHGSPSHGSGRRPESAGCHREDGRGQVFQYGQHGGKTARLASGKRRTAGDERRSR